ncbi:MAG TPA: hypothetical protein VFE13_02685 [Caulobacteraceae bacterium]|nr:hypothetical protein [Caulobacteraceae bacterium]
MSVDRRALIGFGVLGASAVATGAVVLLRSRPDMRGLVGQSATLSGFVGGEKMAFLANPKTIEALKRRGFVLNADREGSVEQVRDPQLLGRKPDFLWPSSAPLVELAKKNAKVLTDQVIFNSPIVVYSWESIADGLVKVGMATKEATHYRVDAKALIQAVIDGKPWSDLGQSDLYGHVRLIATDPNKSNSGFMFAGLAADILTGDVANAASLPKVLPQVVALFEAMGFKSHSSGQAFDDYIAGGPGAQPLVVGYENQLVEWIIADPDRWKRVQGSGGARPVTLYLHPTVYSAHPLIALSQGAVPLIEALTSPELLSIGWRDHGFRGPLGAIGADTDPLVAGRMPAQITDVAPMPDIDTMLAILDRLSGSPATPSSGGSPSPAETSNEATNGA